MPGGTRELNRPGDMPRVPSLNRVYVIPGVAEDDGTPVGIRTSLVYSSQEGMALNDRVDNLESTITTSVIYVSSWSTLRGRTGEFDGQGAVVVDTDTGNHSNASGSAYNGPTVPNAGHYSWVQSWGRWLWISESIGERYLEKTELRFRPGDAPANFDLGTGVTTNSSHGRAVRVEEATTIISDYFTPLEDMSAVEFRTSFFRITNTPDPDNDAVQVSVNFYGSNKNLIESRILLTRLGLVNADGREEVFRQIVRDANLTGDNIVQAPGGTCYVKPKIEFFGIGHATGVDLMMARGLPRWVQEAGRVRAEGVYTPDENFEWPEEWIPGYSVERVFYVSQGGDDSNNGESLRKPVRSIEQARDLLVASEQPGTIMVYPGEYPTSGHIDFPDNCTGIVGQGSARSTRIIPTPGNEEKNQFRMGDGGYVQGFSFEGWRVDSLDDPTEGFAVSFRPEALIRRTVYAHNITVWRGGQPVLIPPPLDRENGNPLVGRGGGVALADRATVSGYSVFPQIMLWGATPVSPNGIGYCAKNGAFINGINAVALWMHKQYMCLSGGRMILTNCASQFGDYTIWSEGSRQEVKAGKTAGPITVQENAANAIDANKQSIINSMWSAMGSYNVDQELTRRDAEFFLTAISFDFRSGQQESSQRFVQGLFDYKGDFVAPNSAKAAFLFSFQNMQSQINSLGISGSAQSMLTGLVNMISETINNPTTRTVPSAITAVGHQWNNTMAGVNGRALDRPSLEVPDSIIEKDLGTVTFSGIDDQGKFYFTGGALVNPLTGQFEGPPVDRTILPRARRAATIVGGYS